MQVQVAVTNLVLWLSEAWRQEGGDEEDISAQSLAATTRGIWVGGITSYS